jgi:DNA-binding SARP family transcriptional activator/Flp pilus assembly protein TadD
MVTAMEFCLLGSLAVHCGDTALPIRPGKQRAVLAALLLNANRVVPVEELAETLWGSAPPPSARVTVQNYVARLRKALGDEDQVRIGTQPRGYVINVAAGELDMTQFEVLLGVARQAAKDGRCETAAAKARAALALWRGEPLADVESELLALREVPRLVELRLQALETRIEADLHLGRHSEVTGELRHLAAVHPLREHLHALLMLALYRDGRQAEALAVYQAARQFLLEELGAEPGPELRNVHQQILAADPTLDPPTPLWPAGGAGRAVPRELPAGVRHFTGRTSELAALTRLLHEAKWPGIVVISAIGGTAGVGKTALAVHWARQVAAQFPDGQLYVNLRGYDSARPVIAADALAAFLRALGVDGQNIPVEEAERSARYRSLLTGKHVLVILDNASDVEQVRPLLPASPGCAVVITSRNSLVGLVARDGAARLDLDLLPLSDAVALLRRLIGTRADMDPAAVEELATQCCRLPLALRLAAELAAARPGTLVSDVVAELTDEQRRLDVLDADGDPRTAVRAVFSWSYDHLDAEAARGYRLAGLHPGPHFDPYAIAALAGTPVDRARHVLDVLDRAHLMQAASPGRYGMHDLLRAYARELTATLDAGPEQHAALTRLFDYYLYTAAAAMDSLFPAEHCHRPRIPQPAIAVPSLADPAAARDWLERERPALISAAGHAADCGWPGHATRLAATISRYLDDGGYFLEALSIFGHALSAARRTSDRSAEATALNQIGSIDWQQGRLQQARDRYRRALAMFRMAGDRPGEAHALGNLGFSETALGRYEQATRRLQEAVTIFRDIGDRLGEARALGLLGLAWQRQGRYREAASYHQQTLDLSREIDDGPGEAWALARLGVINLRLGRCQPAARFLQQALAIFRDIGHAGGESEVLARLGEVYVGLGHYDQAAESLEQALEMSRQIGDPVRQAATLNGLGEVFFQTGDAERARAHHASALQLASEAGSLREKARAHSGLARAHHASGNSLQARHHGQQALIFYTAVGAPEAEDVRARLTETGEGRDNGVEPTEEDPGSGGTAAPVTR